MVSPFSLSATPPPPLRRIAPLIAVALSQEQRSRAAAEAARLRSELSTEQVPRPASDSDSRLGCGAVHGAVTPPPGQRAHAAVARDSDA